VLAVSPGYPCFDIMKHIAPGSIAGSSFLPMAAVMASSTWAFDEAHCKNQ
jgi:hypothetical protein